MKSAPLTFTAVPLIRLRRTAPRERFIDTDDNPSRSYAILLSASPAERKRARLIGKCVVFRLASKTKF